MAPSMIRHSMGRRILPEEVERTVVQISPTAQDSWGISLDLHMPGPTTWLLPAFVTHTTLNLVLS